MTDAVNLSRTYVHLGTGARATPVPDFAWDETFLTGYGQRFAADGDEGRLVCIAPHEANWERWERHPAGEEVVVVLSGHLEVVQDVGGDIRVIEVRAGEAVTNPAGMWHTANVVERCAALYITPGRGTEHRDR